MRDGTIFAEAEGGKVSALLYFHKYLKNFTLLLLLLLLLSLLLLYTTFTFATFAFATFAFATSVAICSVANTVQGYW